MKDPNRNYVDALTAAKLVGVNIATIRRQCKKLLKSSSPEVQDIAYKEFELDSERFIYMIDKDYVLNKWGEGEDEEEEEKVKPEYSQASTNSVLDRALSLMETTIKTLDQQNRQLMAQNDELKEQNKQFYALLNDMSKRGFFLDAPKPAGATTSGQASVIVEQQPVEQSPKKKGFFGRLFS